jgi:putative colanic acid biosynthesis UDP-glucose lipid carrier transferase
MKKLHRHFSFRLGSDLILLTLSFRLSSYWARLHAAVAAPFWSLTGGELVLLAALLAVWVVSSRVTGLYDEFRPRVATSDLSLTLKNTAVQVMASIVLLFVLKTLVLNRYFIGLYALFQVAVLVVWHGLSLPLLRRVGFKGLRPGNLLIVGGGRVAREFGEMLSSSTRLGVRVCGFVTDRPKPELGPAYLGTIDDLGAVLTRRNVGQVVVALPPSAARRIARVVSVCEYHMIPVRIIPNCYRFVESRFDVSLIGRFPVMSLRKTPLEEFQWRALKRGLDLALTVAGFVLVFSWLWPLLALAVKVESSGPVFFKQERWGRKNKRIVCYKFRSMIDGSRDCDENGCYRPAQKHDERITRVGRFLRRTSLDELPQFLNVLRGEMSIVGPRPHPVPLNVEWRDKIPRYTLRHLIKPGITGWAQVNGLRGSAADPRLMQKRVDHDLEYIRNWSFGMDLRIVAMTVWLLIRGDRNAF